MARLLLSCTLLAAFAVLSEAIGSQRVVVKGQLICPSNPKHAAQVPVRTIDKDPGLDDKIADNKTDSNGFFYLDGSATDIIGSIEPRLKV